MTLEQYGFDVLVHLYKDFFQYTVSPPFPWVSPFRLGICSSKGQLYALFYIIPYRGTQGFLVSACVYVCTCAHAGPIPSSYLGTTNYRKVLGESKVTWGFSTGVWGGCVCLCP